MLILPVQSSLYCLLVLELSLPFSTLLNLLVFHRFLPRRLLIYQVLSRSLQVHLLNPLPLLPCLALVNLPLPPSLVPVRLIILPSHLAFPRSLQRYLMKFSLASLKPMTPALDQSQLHCSVAFLSLSYWLDLIIYSRS